jgi:hypothetical protein
MEGMAGLRHLFYPEKSFLFAETGWDTDTARLAIDSP